jgi:hypothetical protein
MVSQLDPPLFVLKIIFPAKNKQWHAYSTNTYYRLDERGGILHKHEFKKSYIKYFIEFNDRQRGLNGAELFKDIL